jgi:YidC/Oxa1 family membrane protein insertase
MALWDQFVMLLVTTLFALAHTCGGLGPAIIMLSLSARLAFLPLTVRMARRAQERQAILHALDPMIRTLKKKYRSDPRRLRAELVALYRRYGYSPVDMKSLADSAIQLPVVVGLYTAIKRSLGAGGRFLWISNLAQPDALLAALIGVLTYVAVILSPGMPQQIRLVAALLPALLAMYFAWTLASGLGLYWASFAAVGILESRFLRRSLT